MLMYVIALRPPRPAYAMQLDSASLHPPLCTFALTSASPR